MDPMMPVHSSILLIDDSQGECELFRLALDQSGFEVVLYTEHDAEAALHFLADRAGHEPLPSVILLDWHLQKQHGDDLLHRLRADHRLTSIPVVVFTTSDHASDLAASYRHGTNGYAVKPGTFEELVRFATDFCRYWIAWNLSPGSFMSASTAIADTLLQAAGSPLSQSTNSDKSTPPSITAPRASFATRLRNFVTNRHERSRRTSHG